MHILAAHTEEMVQTIGNASVQSSLLRKGSAFVQGDLNDHALCGSRNAEIGGIDDQVCRRILGYDLKAIVLRHVDGEQSVVNNPPDGSAVFDWFACGKFDADEWHGVSHFG